MAINADIPISTSQAISQQPVGFQQAGTYINFGAGTLSTPQENNLTPSNSATATSAAQSPSGVSSASGISAYLPIIAITLSLASFVFIVSKRAH
jgi:hypothetical protein